MVTNTKWGSVENERFCPDTRRRVKRTVEEMTPQDVTNRKAGRVRELRNTIKRYQEYIANAEAEIKAWENL